MRGKAGTPVEFGAKLSVSVRDGYVFLDRISWENFNEAGDLKAQIEAFKQHTATFFGRLALRKVSSHSISFPSEWESYSIEQDIQAYYAAVHIQLVFPASGKVYQSLEISRAY